MGASDWMVEIKMTARRGEPVEGQVGLKAKALEALAAMNPAQVEYRTVFADAEVDPARRGSDPGVPPRRLTYV